jgi:hypothetical protein
VKSQFRPVDAKVNGEPGTEKTPTPEASVTEGTRPKDGTQEVHTVQAADSKVITTQTEETTVSAVSGEERTNGSTSRTTAKSTNTKDANAANRMTWVKFSEENFSTSAENQDGTLREDAKSRHQRKNPLVETGVANRSGVAVARRKRVKV